MPRVNWNEISLGNLLSMLTMAAGLIATMVVFTHTVDAVQAAYEKKDLEHDMKIAAIETKLQQSVADHDVLIEIRSDLKFIKQTLEQRTGARP